MLSVGIAWQNFQTLRLRGLIELLPRRFGNKISLADYKELVPLKILRGIDWGAAVNRTTRSTPSALS